MTLSPQSASMSFWAMSLAVLVALIWGFNFAASKFAVQHFPPFYVIFIRYGLVTLLLLPFAKKLPITWRQIFILSLLMISIHFTFVFTALWMGLDIATTVIAIQLGAPFSCVFGALFLKDYLGPWRSVGMLIAFCGIVIIAGTPNVTGNFTAFAFAVIGAMAWGASNVYMKLVRQSSIMPLLFWTGLFSLPQTLLVSLIVESGHLELLHTAPASAWIGITYSAIVSTVLGYGLWYWLIQRYDVTQVAPFALMVPIGGFSSGIFFFDEALSTQLIVGGLVTLAGVAVITFRRPRLARPARS